MVILLSPSSISSSSTAFVSRYRFIGLGDGLGDLRLGTGSDFNCGGGARGAWGYSIDDVARTLVIWPGAPTKVGGLNGLERREADPNGFVTWRKRISLEVKPSEDGNWNKSYLKQERELFLPFLTSFPNEWDLGACVRQTNFQMEDFHVQNASQSHSCSDLLSPPVEQEHCWRFVVRGHFVEHLEAKITWSFWL